MRTIAVLLLLASPAAAQITGNVDYLYWQANSSDFHHYIDRGPDTEHAGSGVRAGIGYRLNCWEASWNYTYYASDAFGERSYPISYWEEYLSSDDSLDYQVHDIQLLRRFCLGQCCELDVFGGFRWGQVDRTSQNLWLQGEGSGAQHSYLTSISRTDSYGGRLGGKFRVQLTDELSWFATGAFSGLLSTTDTVRHDLNTIVPGGALVVNYHIEHRDTHETHSVEAATGLSWTFANIELATGYEWHVWSDIIQRRREPWIDYRDLVLEGLFARFAFVY